jgi:glycosyltransferase involved in cell wall biosynthesis
MEHKSALQTIKRTIKRYFNFFGLEIHNLNGLRINTFKGYRGITNYNLSVIIPFFKKINEFKEVLPHNQKYFERNGIEVIICLDEPTEEKQLLELIEHYPFINWKVIINDVPHSWRNPSKAINVGIRHSTKEYIMVMSPESQLQTDAIDCFVKYLRKKERSFVLGFIQFEHYDNKLHPYGSIAVRKSHLVAINGYNEAYSDWGSDDDDIRVRLTRSGLREKRMKKARLFHREFLERRFKPTSASSADILQKTRESDAVVANDSNYTCNTFAWKHAQAYLATFLAYEITSEPLHTKRNIVALIQSRNNLDIQEFLSHVAEHSDGIILLDDGSTDTTYEDARHPKLLMKAKKQHKEFNDLENRNILLNLASFVNSEWFYFIDTDERFDQRFQNVRDAITRPADIVWFKVIHMWNKEGYYRKDYPLSINGVQYKSKMFSSIGRCQIYSEARFHFNPTPYHSDKIYRSNILLLHYGNFSKQQREYKYDFYTKNDTLGDQSNYDHLRDEHVVLGQLKDLNLKS